MGGLRRTDTIVASPRHSDERPTPWGYIAAILISALGHAGLLAFVFLVIPRLFHTDESPPPSYTVKIVDNLPAGDLGTHLPRLAPKLRTEPVKHAEAHETKPKELKPPELPKEPDKDAIALNAKKLPSRTRTPTPTPTPTPEPTASPAPKPKPHHQARHKPTPEPTHTPKKKLAHPHPTSKPERLRKHEEEGNETEAKADAKPAPSIQEQLAKIREDLLAQHLREEQKTHAHNESGSGPVLADRDTEGKGMGIGSGTGSMGIQQDLAFLLYYRTVQQRIKQAWSFSGGSGDLTTTVDFSIGPDGSLIGVTIAKSSNDPAYDQSVIRAIKQAAPFPAPPEKYRSEFAHGVEALFKLGELKSS